MIRNIPSDKIGKLRDNTFYFFLVSRADWLDGRFQRIRLKYKVAKRLSITVNHKIEWAEDQTKPDGGVSGSQKAFIYGTSTKKTKLAKRGLLSE